MPRVAPEEDIEAGRSQSGGDDVGGGHAWSSHQHGPTGVHFEGDRREIDAASDRGAEGTSIPSRAQPPLNAMGAGWDGAGTEARGLRQPLATQDPAGRSSSFTQSSMSSQTRSGVTPSFQKKWTDQYRMVVHPSRSPSPPHCAFFLAYQTQHLTLSAVLAGNLRSWHNSCRDSWGFALLPWSLHARFSSRRWMGRTVGRYHMDIHGRLAQNVQKRGYPKSSTTNGAKALLHTTKKLIQLLHTRCHSPGSWAASPRCCLPPPFTCPASDPSVPVTTKLYVRSGSV